MSDKKYIVTIEQLAKIVDYCVYTTIAGGECNKDWTQNVEEAIALNGTRTISREKIPLVEYEEQK